MEAQYSKQVGQNKAEGEFKRQLIKKTNNKHLFKFTHQPTILHFIIKNAMPQDIFGFMNDCYYCIRFNLIAL